MWARVRQYPFWPLLAKYRNLYTLGLISLVFVDLINAVLPLAIGSAIDSISAKSRFGIVRAASLYLILMVLQAIGRYLWRVYLIGTSHRVAKTLRRDLYACIQELPLSYSQKVSQGDLMSRATNDIESIRMAVGPGILIAVDAILVFVFIIPIMFLLSWKLSLLVLAFYPLVPWITSTLGSRIEQMLENLQQKMSELGAFAQESFGAIRLIKSLVLESANQAHFRKLSEEYKQSGVLLSRYQSVFSPTLGFITNLGTFLLLWIGGLDVMKGLISIGTFVAFQRYVVQLSWPMEALGWAVTMQKEGFAAFRRVLQVMEEPPVFTDSSRISVRPVNYPLEVMNLDHSFEIGNFRLRLNHLKIEAGQKIGLVGPVGAGKSTFFNLVLRLYEPPPNTLFFQGRDVTTIPLNDLRKKIASVEQQVFLFSESVNLNITLGIQKAMDPSEIEKTANTVRVHREILQLTEGFESRLGERGVNLSGGQKQRIALVRALVRNPHLLLLDDCFSAVDVEVESSIIENILASFPDLTLCFASHRLSIMPRLDSIWVINQGQLVDQGPHHQLIKRCRLYQELWNKSEKMAQFEKEEAQLCL